MYYNVREEVKLTSNAPLEYNMYTRLYTILSYIRAFCEEFKFSYCHHWVMNWRNSMPKCRVSKNYTPHTSKFLYRNIIMRYCENRRSNTIV